MKNNHTHANVARRYQCFPYSSFMCINRSGTVSCIIVRTLVSYVVFDIIFMSFVHINTNHIRVNNGGAHVHVLIDASQDFSIHAIISFYSCPPCHSESGQFPPSCLWWWSKWDGNLQPCLWGLLGGDVDSDTPSWFHAEICIFFASNLFTVAHMCIPVRFLAGW